MTPVSPQAPRQEVKIPWRSSRGQYKQFKRVMKKGSEWLIHVQDEWEKWEEKYEDLEDCLDRIASTMHNEKWPANAQWPPETVSQRTRREVAKLHEKWDTYCDAATDLEQTLTKSGNLSWICHIQKWERRLCKRLPTEPAGVNEIPELFMPCMMSANVAQETPERQEN